jgi:hypothetical protein
MHCIFGTFPSLCYIELHQVRSYLWVLEWVLENIMAGEKLLSETAFKAAKPTTNMYYLNDGELAIG